MSAETRDRLRACLRVVASVLAALVLGSAPTALLGLSGPVLFASFGFVLGSPALVVALAVQFARRRSVRARLARWCLVAPFAAAIVTLGFFAALDVLMRVKVGRGFAEPSGAIGLTVFSLYYGAIASGVFYLWERRAQASRAPA